MPDDYESESDRPEDAHEQDPLHEARQAFSEAMHHSQGQIQRAMEELSRRFSPEEASQRIQALVRRGVEGRFDDVAEGVGRLGIVFVNVYALNTTGGRWFLLDTGLPGFARAIRAACEARYEGRPPEGIILSHSQFDHAGNAQALASEWNVPVYVHQKDLPFVNGEADYPPADPTPGGAICFMSRFFPMHGYRLTDSVEVRTLTGDSGEVEGLEGWRWHHTPGQSPGHISLFRQFDQLLLAGDAVATMDLDSWQAQLTWSRELSRPPTPVTFDWEAARRSVDKLADLNPRTVAAGHGLPIDHRHVAGQLHDLARTMQPPEGRYARQPVEFDEAGHPVHVPPARPDPLRPKLNIAAGLAVAGLAVAAIGLLRRR